MKIHNTNSYENINPYNQSRIEETFVKQDNTNNYVFGQQQAQWQANDLSKSYLEEQRLMRKAYCKVNNIPYEEPEEIPSLGQGSLKVLVVIVWLFIVGIVLSSLIGEGNFLTNFMKVWL